METPASLLQRLSEPQSQQAWIRFVHLYTPLFYHWAQRLGLQESDAADLVQDVFVAMCQVLPSFRYDHQRSFRAWLFTLMRRKWQDWRRRRVPAPIGNLEATLAEQPNHDAEDALEETEYRAYLYARALHLIQEEFAPTTWKTFWATVVEGRSAVEVAREFGVTANAVYLARGRILRRLREEFDGLLE
jgi:RNA polymerase sigma factor (sigma-70 family)